MIKSFKVPFCKHKYTEIVCIFKENTLRPTRFIFNIDTSWQMKCDHAGFRFLFISFRLQFEFNIYDNRHWNYKEKRYFREDENPFKKLIHKK